MNQYTRLTQLLERGEISRRDFMKRAAALGLTGAVAASFPGAAAWASTPSRGGHLRVGIGHGSTSDSLDPGTYSDSYMISVGRSIHNYLTEVDQHNELIGEVAESWEASPDAREWAFKLRQGVEFHNGRSIDANDVVASFNHHRGEDSTSAAKGIVEAIEDIQADGSDTVVFTLREGNADFPFICSDYHIPIIPATDGGVDLSGVGCGAYVLESFEPGVRTSMTRNPNYWKQGRAHFDSGEILVIVDVTSRTNALTTGEIDVMDRVDFATAHLLERNPNITVDEASGNQHYTFAMRTDTAPFDNNHVRQALKYGVDREAMLRTVLRGRGYVGNDHPIGRANRFLATELEQRQHDPDRARYHLQQAGLDSLSVDLSASDAAFTGAVDAAVLYREHAAPAGIDINVVRESSDGYWSNVWMVKPWSAVYWSGRPTEDWMFSIAYAAGAAWNDSFWEHEQFNNLLRQARAELDEPKRAELYAECQRLTRDEGGVVVPMFANFVFARNNRVQHDEAMAADWDVDGLRYMERWWFES